MRSLRLFSVGAAVFFAVLSPALPAGMCGSLITSWLGFDPPPQISLERSFDDLFSHLDYGSLESAQDGKLQIKSGVHTYGALERILKSHDLQISKSNQRQIKAAQLEGKELHIETLLNGVIRVQMGEDIWVSEMARDNARVTVAPEETYRGIKTLFPKSMSADLVRQVMEGFFAVIYERASLKEITSSHHSVEECFEPQIPNVTPMRLKMVLVYGRPVSFFPTWIQDSCY